METLVLDAAVDLVDLEGLGTGLEGITYTKVFRHLEASSGVRVTRASVHERLWADQGAFQAAVRRRLLETADPETIPDVIDLTGETTSESDPAVVTAADSARRVQALATIRTSLAYAPEHERSDAAECVEMFRSSQRRRLDALTTAYTRRVGERGGVVAESHGLDLESAMALVVRAVAATAEGAAIQAPFDSGTAPEPGSLAALVGESLLERFFEFTDTPAESA